MKKVIQIVLALAIVGLGYVLVEQIMTPIRFQNETKARELAVIEQIKDIRAAEQAFKKKYLHYTSDFDSLINFVLTEELEFERKLIDEDDSVALATAIALAKRSGKTFQNVETFTIPAIDTIFGAKKLTPEQVRNLPVIPYSAKANNGQPKKFYLNAGLLTTGAGVVVPVFECRAHYGWFLNDLNKQELVNLIDEKENVYEAYPGIKVGDMEQATNDAGNWE